MKTTCLITALLRHQMLILNIGGEEEERNGFTAALASIRPGDTCIHANGFNSGLKTLKILVPDVIFLHSDTPGIKEKFVLNSIRADRNVANVPVFTFSKTLSTDYIRKFTEYGVNRCLLKPDNFHGMCTVLDGVLRQDARREPGETMVHIQKLLFPDGLDHYKITTPVEIKADAHLREYKQVADIIKTTPHYFEKVISMEFPNTWILHLGRTHPGENH